MFNPLAPLAFTLRTSMHECFTTSVNAIQPHASAQIFKDLGIKQFKSPPTLLDETAIKSTPEPSKPSRFTTFDQACQYPEAKQSVHHGQAGPVRMVKVGGMAFFPKNDAAAFNPKAVLSNALEPSAALETASAAEALGPDPPCAAVSQAVMKPKSYAAIAKASVVTTTPPQPAAVPKPKLSTAASMPSTDSKRSATTSELTAHTTSLKVTFIYVLLYMCMLHL